MNLLISVQEAIDSLTTFREKHIADYKEALGVWREDMATYSKLIEEWVAGDGVHNRPSEPSRPRNYLREYDKMIAKLGRHLENSICLSDSEYSTIFEDEYYWQGNFQRQKAPIYAMGSSNPSDFTSSIAGNKIVAGTLSSNKIVGSSIRTADLADGLHVPIEE